MMNKRGIQNINECPIISMIKKAIELWDYRPSAITCYGFRFDNGGVTVYSRSK